MWPRPHFSKPGQNWELGAGAGRSQLKRHTHHACNKFPKGHNIQGLSILINIKRTFTILYTRVIVKVHTRQTLEIRKFLKRFKAFFPQKNVQ